MSAEGNEAKRATHDIPLSRVVIGMGKPPDVFHSLTSEASKTKFNNV